MSWICDKGHEYLIPPTLLIELDDGTVEIEKVCPQCVREFFETNMKLTEIEPVPAKLHGKVTAPDGQTIENIQVTLNGYSAETQLDGNYFVDNILPEREYPITFSDPLGRFKTKSF